ncbi:DNA alkylation repair protein [Candidatus Wolfebacteria bacterium]|nr:DNA alkylation repair protein [Candidatus Wolfebacteria bacterium]
MSILVNLKRELKLKADPERAKILQGFFKTGKGEYGEGDIFLGLVAPKIREIALKYKNLKLGDLQKLLKSKIHEERVAALRILVDKFQKSGEMERKKIFNFYLKNAKRVNNWDLVDLSAPKIVGEYLLNKNRKILYKLVKSKNIWERRIAVLATFAFIDKNEFNDSLKIAEILLKDKHDLIHKAVGWMLREMGKKSQKSLEDFLKKHFRKMPRTMLRYSIEKLSETKRKMWLKK